VVRGLQWRRDMERVDTRETRRTLDLGRPVDPHEREVGRALQAAFDQFQVQFQFQVQQGEGREAQAA
jgi:hypothetical protein